MKKNIRKVPQDTLNRIHSFELDDIVVACVKRLKHDELPRYASLGVKLVDGSLTLPKPFVPKPSAGSYSKANIEGKDILLKHLPKVTRTDTWETPNWGDWSKGSHTHSTTRLVYQRDFLPPKEVELSIELLETLPNDEYVLKFAVDQVLSKRSSSFDADLLYNLNILQENVGAADVFPSAATLAEYMATVRVDWEILPPGTIDEVVKRILLGKRRITEDQKKTMEERLKVMARYKPAAYIAGTSGFLRYFGAKFEDDFVAFENLAYGNALYVMFEGWETLSRRSRVDLLRGPRDGFERIEHRDGWAQQLSALLKRHRKNKSSQK
ncbi:hypothetical protein V1283_008280 [Bradyrhizobium sp. AZCC 2262]|uniref:hypothetical protein n=1 Tax=Bradyrhizobium sp. AZCC 2262 TaxID=3117022 RepID=UPI002FEEC657